MLQTPLTFTPLLRAEDHPDPLTFVFHGSRLLLHTASLALPENLPLALLVEHIHPLAMWTGRDCQVAWTEHEALDDAAHQWHSLRSLFGNVDEGFLGLAGRAVQIVEWARTHRFCGVCATPMGRAPGERAFKCPAC